MPQAVFLSYGSTDRSQVTSLATELEAAGVRAWIDHAGIQAGENWSASIVAALERCSAVVVLLSEASAGSPYVQREIALAAEARKTIIPVYLTALELPPALKLHLAGIQHIDLAAVGIAEAARRIAEAVPQVEPEATPPAEPSSTVPPPIPSGTVTFLFTDIEGSTRMWERQRDVMAASLARHDALMRSAIGACRGFVFKTIGDAFCAAFGNPEEGIAAALLAQQRLAAEAWPEETPIRVRMALHTGAVESRDNDYFGPTVNRVARLLATGAGGQVLISNTTYALTSGQLPDDASLLDLGEHRLKDLSRPEHVYHLVHPAIPREFPPLRSLGAMPNNLPQRSSPFVGREPELAEIQRLLGETRLLTLAGIGGAGKTRLSLQAAAEQLDEMPDGAWFVELAAITDPAVVVSAVASALSVRETPGTPLVDAVISSVRDRRLLLILDNCEHLIDDCARLVDRLLRSCARLKVLATSRQPLGIEGEAVYRVPSLRLPEPKRRVSLGNVSEYEALELFVQRARAVQPGFAVEEASLPALVSICRQLDGIPLAIELAAARVRSLSLPELNQRLKQRFRLLTGGSRAAEPRQQTLRALIDWSYNLLSPEEQLLFRRLSRFVGGWTLQAAETVCSGESPEGGCLEEWEILDLLTSLVDKSLILAETHGETSRYRMLETVRQYAVDQSEPYSDAALIKRHAEFFIALAREAHLGLNGPDQALWAHRLDADYDNMRAVIRRSLASGENESALILCGLLLRYWYFRAHFREGREYCAEALNAAKDHPPDEVLANAIGAAAAFAYLCDDPEECERLNVRALEIRRAVGDTWGVSQSLNMLGLVNRNRGDYAKARELYAEQLALCRETGERHTLGVGLSNLGLVENELGNYEGARACMLEALELYLALGDKRSAGQVYNNLGLVAFNEKRLEEALQHHEDSARLFEELGDRWNVASALGNIANIATMLGDRRRAFESYEIAIRTHVEMEDQRSSSYVLQGVAGALLESDPVAAVQLLGAVDRIRATLRIVLAPHAQEMHEKHLATGRERLSGSEFEAAFAAGQELSLKEAEAVCLEALQRARAIEDAPHSESD